MLKQAVGKTVTPWSQLASNWLNVSPLADPSTPRRSALKLDALSQSKPFKLDVLDAGLLNANLRATDSLNIVDAPDTDNLFALSATRSVKAMSNMTTLAGTRNNSVEWGDPLTDQYYWRVQRRQASCAVVAQISIYESLTGDYITEGAACKYAQAHRWLNPKSGTPLNKIGKVLNVLGISTVHKYKATLDDIAIALANGDKPIVGLDANEIWNPKRDRYGNPVEQTDVGHAVWVTGIDRKANGSYNVILNDSGHAKGRSEVVKFVDFYNAWEDYQCFLTVADNPLT